MAQILTAVSILALAGVLWWRYHDHGLDGWQSTPGSAAIDHAHLEHSARPIQQASAYDFMRGAADLTFGVLVLALGFFMLMWLIATA